MMLEQMAQRFRAYHKASSKTFDLKRNDKTFLLSIFLPLFVIKAVFVIANATGPSIISDEYIYKFNAESLFLLQKYANAHYPPMYPLALAPAFAIERWYECMLVINAFISSLIVPAVWFLARSIGMNNPRVPAVLAALIPFHAVYPGFLLGENLFVPLFCLTLALAVRGDKASTQEGALFGAVLGMTHLTKYLFLPAIPLLYLAWLYAAYGLREKGDDRGLVHALSPALSYALVIGIWIWYGLHSGFDWRQMFGLDISTAGRLITNSSAIAHELEKHSRPAALLKWAAAYASFIVLAWMPTWGLAAAWLTQAKPNGHDGDKSDRKSRIFIILLALLIAGFCAIATLHSFGAKYNATQPTKIMGRYLAQLAPPMLVLATFFLESLSHMEIRLRTRKFAFASAFMTAIFSLSWWVIAQGGVWDFPKFFYKNQVNLLDVSIFGKFGYLPLGIGTIIVPLLMVSPSGRRQALLAAPLGAFLLCFSLGYARMAPFHSEGMNLRMIVNAAASPEYRGKEIRVITDKSRPQPKALQGAAQFWGLDEISLIPQEIPQETDSWSTLKGQCLLLTTHQFQFPAVNAFSFKEKNFFIYGITENNLEAIKAYFATAEEGELP